MSRMNQEQNRAEGFMLVKGSKFGVMSQVLGATISISKEMPTMLFLDANGAARNVVFPAVTADMKGMFFVVKNTAGAAFALTIQNSALATIGTLTQGSAGMAVCDGTIWHFMGW